MKKSETFFFSICGAFLLGFLWRLRGTHGWGAGWGLLASGFVFLLFLSAVLRRPKEAGFASLCVAAFSFMLTTPGWGTLLESITGVLTVNSKATDETLQAYVSPFSAIIPMLLLGFGLASVFGILSGKYLGNHKWRLIDYLILLIVFVAVGELCKATVSHILLRIIEPQASALFADGLQKEGIQGSVYSAYMSHYGNMAWAKKILGGRHYFSCISTIAFALQAIAVLLTTRFFIRDAYAAKTGAVICSSFALSITVSDLFFFFSKGGYHMQQGFSFPQSIAAWSMWEYGTGFLAGGLITAFLLLHKPESFYQARPDAIADKLRFLQSPKLKTAWTFILCFIGGLGIHAVRPVLLRLDESALQIPCTIAAAVLAIVISVLLCSRYDVNLQKADYPMFTGTLCFAAVLWFAILYLFFPDAQILELHALHNKLVLCSVGIMSIWYLYWRITSRKIES